MCMLVYFVYDIIPYQESTTLQLYFRKICEAVYVLKGPELRARINEELAKSNFDFFLELNLICV